MRHPADCTICAAHASCRPFPSAAVIRRRGLGPLEVAVLRHVDMSARGRTGIAPSCVWRGWNASARRLVAQGLGTLKRDERGFLWFVINARGWRVLGRKLGTVALEDLF